MMTAAFDPVEVALRLIDLLAPYRRGRPGFAGGELLDCRERRAVAAAFAGSGPSARCRIGVAAFRDARDSCPTEMRACVRQRSLVE